MSEHEKQTAFLSTLIEHQNIVGCRELREKLRETIQSERCVRRATFAVLIVAMLSLSALGYAAVLNKSFLEGGAPFIAKFLAVTGLGSTLSLLGFTAFWVHIRSQIRRLHRACRDSIMGSIDHVDPESERHNPDPIVQFEGNRLGAMRRNVDRSAVSLVHAAKAS